MSVCSHLCAPVCRSQEGVCASVQSAYDVSLMHSEYEAGGECDIQIRSILSDGEHSISESLSRDLLPHGSSISQNARARNSLGSMASASNSRLMWRNSDESLVNASLKSSENLKSSEGEGTHSGRSLRVKGSGKSSAFGRKQTVKGGGCGSVPGWPCVSLDLRSLNRQKDNSGDTLSSVETYDLLAVDEQTGVGKGKKEGPASRRDAVKAGLEKTEEGVCIITGDQRDEGERERHLDERSGIEREEKHERKQGFEVKTHPRTDEPLSLATKVTRYCDVYGDSVVRAAETARISAENESLKQEVERLGEGWSGACARADGLKVKLETAVAEVERLESAMAEKELQQQELLQSQRATQRGGSGREPHLEGQNQTLRSLLDKQTREAERLSGLVTDLEKQTRRLRDGAAFAEEELAGMREREAEARHGFECERMEWAAEKEEFEMRLEAAEANMKSITEINEINNEEIDFLIRLLKEKGFLLKYNGSRSLKDITRSLHSPDADSADSRTDLVDLQTVNLPAELPTQPQTNRNSEIGVAEKVRERKVQREVSTSLPSMLSTDRPAARETVNPTALSTPSPTSAPSPTLAPSPTSAPSPIRAPLDTRDLAIQIADELSRLFAQRADPGLQFSPHTHTHLHQHYHLSRNTTAQTLQSAALPIAEAFASQAAQPSTHTPEKRRDGRTTPQTIRTRSTARTAVEFSDDEEGDGDAEQTEKAWTGPQGFARETGGKGARWVSEEMRPERPRVRVTVCNDDGTSALSIHSHGAGAVASNPPSAPLLSD